MSQQTVLVLAATGQQGGEVAKQLLAKGHKVHGLTRDVESAKSQELRSAGALMCQGSFDNIDSVRDAAKGCTAMFMVPIPTPSELDEARVAVKAAKSAGIEKCVYSSVTNCDEIVKRPEFNRDMIRASYFLNKTAIQDMVKSEFASWTILQPGAFMTNMVDPVARFYYSRLGSEHVLHGGWKPDTRLGFIDPIDIGKFAVMALETDRLEHKQVPLVGDKLTIPELAAVMTEVSGQAIEAEYIGDEAVEAQKDKNPLVVSADWMNKGWFDVDMEPFHALGIEMNSVKQFLQRQKASGHLEKTLQKA